MDEVLIYICFQNHLITAHGGASPQGEAETYNFILKVSFMNNYNNKKLTANSQKLRKNMTKEERHLWYDFLKEIPVTFHRQKVIGNYIVDFYCASAKMIIELDGSQHYYDEGKQKDEKRDKYLSSLSLTVLRYSNDDVNNSFESVCQDIFNNLISRGAISPPSP